MDDTMEDGAGPLDRVENLIDAEDVEGAVAVIAALHVAGFGFLLGLAAWWV